METKLYSVDMGHVNSYVIEQNNKLILIDAGNKNKIDNLKSKLDKLDKSITDIEYIILTHTHIDHVGSLLEIKKESNAKIIVNKIGEKFLKIGRTSVPNGVTAFGKFMSFLGKILSFFMSTNKYEPIEPDITFDNKLNLDKYDLKGEIIHTPGHTMDSSTIIFDDKFCFVGDTLFNFSFLFSIYPPVANDKKILNNSLKKINKLDFERIYPGHGKPIEKKQFKKLIKKLK